MKSLKSTLDSLNSQLESAQSAEEATGILGFLCPLWWIGTALSASQISTLKEQLSEVRNTYNSKLFDYRSKEAERQNLQADLDGIPLLRTTIEKAEPDIRSVIYKIGSIATCWAAIRADTQGILDKLDYVIDNDSDSVSLFNLRLKTAGDLYKALQAALTAYKEYLDAELGMKLKEILQKHRALGSESGGVDYTPR
ncbi:hypothetical protein K474DRAFT_127020 [Panus rudis PR-1116 ss-1]|nr:hypothetical protein K474DRAFT_127020 [Panus rudis PR-1116 ss-1]